MPQVTNFRNLIILKKAFFSLSLLLAASAVSAGGFGVDEAAAQEQTRAHNQAKQAMVGKTVYFRTGLCLSRWDVRSKPTRYGSQTYKSEKPVLMTISDYVATGADSDGSMSHYFTVSMADGAVGYVEANLSSGPDVSTDYKDSSLVYCVTAYDPQELTNYWAAKKLAEQKETEARTLEYERTMAHYEKELANEKAYRDSLRKKPAATIGMTAKQVRENSNWGRPLKVNRTTTANGTDEQWVYSVGYLYFHNGILRSAQY